MGPEEKKPWEEGFDWPRFNKNVAAARSDKDHQLDPRCDEAVRRFLGLHETMGDPPLQVYEKAPGVRWVTWAPPPR